MFLKIGTPPEHGFDQPLGLLSDCHRRIEHFLSALATVTHDANGGALSGPQRDALGAALTYFAVAAPKHTADEEDSLFPRVEASDDPAAKAALDLVRRLERDHENADAHHRSVDALGRKWLEDGRLPDAEVRELREHLERLGGLYESHIAAEDRELFPAAARLLSETDLRAIGREMAERRSVRFPDR